MLPSSEHEEGDQSDQALRGLCGGGDGARVDEEKKEWKQTSEKEKKRAWVKVQQKP